MGDSRDRRSWRGRIERRELDLVTRVVASIHTTDPAGLESDLMLHLLHLKRRRRYRTGNAAALLWKALRNKAMNWIRNQQYREKGLLSVSAPVDPSDTNTDAATWEDRLKAHESDQVERIAFEHLLDELHPELRQIWQALQRADGNQLKAARSLRIHRNTLRMKLRQIQQVAERHGFGHRR